jgi:hypothetical protein
LAALEMAITGNGLRPIVRMLELPVPKQATYGQLPYASIEDIMEVQNSEANRIEFIYSIILRREAHSMLPPTASQITNSTPQETRQYLIQMEARPVNDNHPLNPQTQWLSALTQPEINEEIDLEPIIASFPSFNLISFRQQYFSPLIVVNKFLTVTQNRKKTSWQEPSLCK